MGEVYQQDETYESKKQSRIVSENGTEYQQKIIFTTRKKLQSGIRKYINW